MQEDNPEAVDVAEQQPPVSFTRFCGIAFAEMVKKRFITSGYSPKSCIAILHSICCCFDCRSAIQLRQWWNTPSSSPLHH